MKDMDGKKRENYECFKNNRERELSIPRNLTVENT
jgi:hypothetical protein